ncbi:MAG: N-acyl homoserine lactonase family protein [Archaeoglobus sp.]|nr:N-acyl homoserine lactonase family protein [Archaeoglobus sp.]
MYTIKPLKQAEIMAPLGVVQMLGDMSSLIVAPVFVWLIEGNDRKILVDAGIQEPVNGFVHNFPVLGGGEKGIREALASAGVKPEEIDALILTHLHFDHVAETELFDNARIYIQKREWKSAFNPPIHYRLVYDVEVIQKIEEMDVCLVNGDFKLDEGIELVFLPGHTQGLQGVKVEANGTYLLAGDHFYSFLNLNPPKEQFELEDARGNKIAIPPYPLPFMPPGLHVDLTEWFDSCFKALSVAKRKRILPGHDPSLIGKVFG